LKEAPCDAPTRREIERLAAKEGLSLDESLNRLLRRATDQEKPVSRRYRLNARKHGFDIAHAKEIAAEMTDARTLDKVKVRV
jgi:hypothetical protein